MDSLLLSEEINQLKKLREHYEYQLKLAGLEMCDLDDNLHLLLDDCVELQRVTNIQDLTLLNLKSFYYKKKKEHIENDVIIAKLKNEIRKQQEELEKEQAECNLLEKFTTSINKRLVSEAQMQTAKMDIEANMQSLQDRLDALAIPEDFNIDELIKKVNLLRKDKTKEK
ncbi:augmin complex subunit wac [Musca vetustissima]|uniref:augmin complex subunit wac n=1 Tax=Musca vetustissima TaxID=27455 RepID=UPI002AB7CA79|nr:augmin complex subunit wac [Musca vetustissima]